MEEVQDGGTYGFMIVGNKLPWRVSPSTGTVNSFSVDDWANLCRVLSSSNEIQAENESSNSPLPNDIMTVLRVL